MTEMVKAKLNGKYEIILPKHRAARPEWYTETGWERTRLDSMHEHIGKGDVVYYVGAEEGDMAALCQIWGAELLLVEPNEKVLPNIKAIWEANQLKPATILCGFFGNKDDGFMVPFKTSDISGEVIHDHGFKELRDPDEIPIRKIDTVVDWDLGFKPPTIISLDVEGSEFEVLRGAEQTLRKYHPKIWLSLHPEFLHEQYGEWGAELRRWIMDLGYIETLLDYPLHEVHLLYTTEEPQPIVKIDTTLASNYP